MQKGDATKDEVAMLGDVTNQIAGHTICAFVKDLLGQYRDY